MVLHGAAAGAAATAADLQSFVLVFKVALLLSRFDLLVLTFRLGEAHQLPWTAPVPPRSARPCPCR